MDFIEDKEYIEDCIQAIEPTIREGYRKLNDPSLGRGIGGIALYSAFAYNYYKSESILSILFESLNRLIIDLEEKKYLKPSCLDKY